MRGTGKLAVDAILGITNIVDSMHRTILSLGGRIGDPEQTQTTGLTGMVYQTVRTITETVGHGLDSSLSQLNSLAIMQDGEPAAGREAVLAALNGVLGDYLVATNNPLAITMGFYRAGELLNNTELSETVKQANGKIAIMLHGSCMNDLQWERKGHDHGGAIFRDLGITPLYLRYNSGLHTSENGKEFSALLEALLAQSEEPMELTIVAHSMGGLVARSAYHYGKEYGHTWMKHLTKIVFLGTPHHGAPLEKGGNWIDTLLEISPYSTPFAQLGKIRSSGVTDLRYGNLLDEDWQGKDRFKRSDDLRTAVPLPDGVLCYAIAGTITQNASKLGDGLIGDGLVTVDSALGRHPNLQRQLLFPESHQSVCRGINHVDLLSNLDVYETLKRWLADGKLETSAD